MMHLSPRVGIVAGMALVLGACADNIHRPRIISDSVVDKEVRDAAAFYTNKNQGSIYQLFVDAAEDAYPDDVAADVDPAAQRIFMQTGFDLVKDRCRAFLARKSDHQRNVNVWRDTFAPITALATGVIGLVDKGETVDNDVLVAIGLASAAATSGIEIYEERFLFSAENVNSVRKLLDNALTVDADEKMELPDSRLRYTKSVEYIVSNQLICSPQNILELVQQAIETGNIVRISRPTPAPSPSPSPAPSPSPSPSAVPPVQPVAPDPDAAIPEPAGVTVAPA